MVPLVENFSLQLAVRIPQPDGAVPRGDCQRPAVRAEPNTGAPTVAALTVEKFGAVKVPNGYRSFSGDGGQPSRNWAEVSEKVGAFGWGDDFDRVGLLNCPQDLMQGP